MRGQVSENGSATAELVVALPFLIALALIGVRFVGSTIHEERLRYLAEGIVQALMREESSSAINRELNKSIPGASFSIVEQSDGAFTVTVRHRAASADAQGFR
ncbi:MAG: hypothetical protein EBX92_03390 [Actinobacteria bacterium]|nr:hypothetical protein [Actinomycetota bacterium]